MMEMLEAVREAVSRQGVSDHAVALFREAVWEHFAHMGRSMPWRQTRDPYRVLVSEVMLQQTQVSRVLERYEEFLEVFPDVRALADASLEDVLRVWKGLGYNRRAVNLHRGARMIVAEHDGAVPCDETVLRGLPGVGPATAAGVACFAFGKPVVYLETNVRSVMLHCFFADREGVHDREVREVVGHTLDRERPREWYYALMDLGAAIKRTHANPGRRSAHHARQAPFEGSDRQIRGRVLEVLLDSGGLAREALVGRLGADTERADRIIDDLATEGFLVQDAGVYRIA